MYYKRWTAEINPKGLYYVRKTYIMESEKRWVTIDGRHVDIGGDGDSGSGGGASRKPKPDVYIEPMPKKQFRKIKKLLNSMEVLSSKVLKQMIS